MKRLTPLLFLSSITAVQVINLYPNSRINLWYSALLGAAASLPILLAQASVSARNPEGGLFDSLELAFGKAVGGFFTLLYVAYGVIISSVTLRYLTEFIKTVSLNNTSQLLLLVLFGGLCGLIASKGGKVTARLSTFIFPAVIIIFAFIILCSLDFYDFSRIVPSLDESVRTFADSAFGISAFGFCESIFILEIMKNSGLPPKKRYLTFIGGLLMSAIFTSAILFSDRLILGNSASILYFPHYEAVSVINVGDFITHIEVISIISFLMCVVVKVSLCLFSAAEGTRKLFKKAKSTYLTAILTAIAIVGGSLIFNSTMDIYSFHSINKYLALFFQAALPICIMIGLKRKKAKK